MNNKNVDGSFFPKHKSLYTFKKKMRVIWMYNPGDGCPIMMVTCMEGWCFLLRAGAPLVGLLVGFSEADEVT